MACWCLPGVLKHAALLVVLITKSQRSSADNGFPPLWDQVTDTLESFATQENEVVINPWMYLERMAMYKVVLNKTAKYFSTLGSDNSGNMLWGLTLQHGWQLYTGMNYYLSVLPFLAAAAADIFENSPPYPIEIVPPAINTMDFCYNIAGCNSSFPDVMTKWEQFYQVLSYHWFTAKHPHLKKVRLYRYQTCDICSQLTSWDTVAGLSYLSSSEEEFGKAWAANVEYIAVTHFATNFQNTNNLQSVLPPQMLKNGDTSPLILNFSIKQNKVLFVLIEIYDLNQSTGGQMLKAWKKAMCSEKGRSEGRQLLQNIATHFMDAAWNVLLILTELIINVNCPV
uniref:Protein LEG1 homolog n=1 Tax=Geotrypetes seraphini TaxID=260995 RepID=A0A6P8R0N6_GEOSA|nr:protein LEG1 homolog [Geotrypetes seraphini]